ncbi:MAG: DUF1836 domain-containing protein [Clostridiales bacterium]|nr:DUF1836 domain-containing protein [Clostridiales bacterium]
MEPNQAFAQGLQEAKLPRYSQLPTLELYKDQLVELTNGYLAPFFLGETAVTDTMVNNYVKLKVIAPPVKKRYRREQLAQLILTCLLKKVLSIAEVRQLLAVQSRDGSIEAGYDAFCQQVEQAVRAVSGSTDLRQPMEMGSVSQEALLNHAICSFVHKLYFEMILAELSEAGE